MAPLIVLGIMESLFSALGLGAEYTLLMLGFRIIVLLFAISFVRSRFEGGPLITILVLVLGYVILFQYWHLFGPLAILYFAIAFGFTSIIYDISFITPQLTEMPEGASEDQRAKLRQVREAAEK